MDLLDNAQIYGMQDIRVLSGKPNDFLISDFISLLGQEEKEGFSFFDAKTKKEYSVLAVSGGAAYGAFGAGLLAGWTESRIRPEFRIVTGISTGAIIAPFAFLGSSYDNELKELYTQHSTKDIMRKKGLLQIFSGNSLASSLPLERLIERHFNKQVLEEIAHEYRKGRRLYVGTANLDAQQLVIWDMGKIASMGDEKALKLFRKVILASATIPVVFPPVYFGVEVNNEAYDEMHVDGGAVKQVFFLYDVLQGFEKAAKEKGVDLSKIKYRIYVIRNGYVDPVWNEVPDKVNSIAERTADSITNAQGMGDTYQLYEFTKIRDGDFNLAYIPATHVSKAKELFDPVEMRELFDLGFEEAAQGYNWKKALPGINTN